MASRTIEIAESVYRRLRERAAALHTTPEQLLEDLVMTEVLGLPGADDDDIVPVPAPNAPEALAAVARLGACFANVTIPNLDAVLADPLIALANVDCDDPHP
jgi:hypothetical protein